MAVLGEVVVLELEPHTVVGEDILLPAEEGIQVVEGDIQAVAGVGNRPEEDNLVAGADILVAGADIQVVEVDSQVVGVDSQVVGMDIQVVGADSLVVEADSQVVVVQSRLEEDNLAVGVDIPCWDHHILLEDMEAVPLYLKLFVI